MDASQLFVQELCTTSQVVHPEPIEVSRRPDVTPASYIFIQALITEILLLYCAALSTFDVIVIISCVLSNTSLNITTYRLGRYTPVDSVP